MCTQHRNTCDCITHSARLTASSVLSKSVVYRLIYMRNKTWHINVFALQRKCYINWPDLVNSDLLWPITRTTNDNVAIVRVPCHRWRRWWPCDARALCLLKPWWAVLDSRYPSTMYINYPDTSVSGAPSLSFPLFFRSPPSFQVHAFSCDPGQQVAVAFVFISVRCTSASLSTSSLLFFSIHISLTSSVKTTFQRPSASPTSPLEFPTFTSVWTSMEFCFPTAEICLVGVA